jgi:hypothetical protein
MFNSCKLAILGYSQVDKMKLSRYLLVSVCGMLALAGCGGSSSTSNPPPPTIGKAYVAGAFSIMRYPAGGNGNISPENSIKLPLSEEPGVLALDVAHDRLVTGANGSIPEVVLGDNASTTMQPVRVISGAATTMLFAGHVAIDSVNDLVYVVSASSSLAVTSNILVFGPASTISGNVAPLRTISLTLLIAGMALDVANNRLFLSDQAGFINVYDNASTLNGAVVPNRVITGAATQVVIPGALALDTSGRLIVANRSNIIPPFTNNILIFSNAGAINGNVAPAATATLADNQMAQAMAISPAGELYVVDGGASLTVYSNIATATGGLLPSRVISGPNTGLNPGPAIPPAVLGVAMDPTR